MAFAADGTAIRIFLLLFLLSNRKRRNSEYESHPISGRRSFRIFVFFFFFHVAKHVIERITSFSRQSRPLNGSQWNHFTYFCTFYCSISLSLSGPNLCAEIFHVLCVRENIRCLRELTYLDMASTSFAFELRSDGLDPRQHSTNESNLCSIDAIHFAVE